MCVRSSTAFSSLQSVCSYLLGSTDPSATYETHTPPHLPSVLIPVRPMKHTHTAASAFSTDLSATHEAHTIADAVLDALKSQRSIPMRWPWHSAIRHDPTLSVDY
eukprot:scpid68349/ scgid31219/ 